LWDAAATCIANGTLGPKAEAAVNGFLQLVEQLGRDIAGLELHEQVDHVINNSGLVEHHKKEKASDRGEARIENLNELVSAARGFEPDGTNSDEEALPPLEAFLSHAVLESGEGQAEAWEDCIQMMTLHTAKGLEFPIVFLSGMEDGLFPHQRSLNDPEGLEEERRLCYVGATRAMKQLFLTYAEQRRLHGMDSFGTPSRFIAEIPEDLIEEIRPRIQISRPVAAGRFKAPIEELAPGVKLGARVRHKKFGEGVILKVEGHGPQANIQVNFASLGVKIMMLEYLEVVR
jgi:DNA helicase-2/ATP-dependent DNA helicase PcrA